MVGPGEEVRLNREPVHFSCYCQYSIFDVLISSKQNQYDRNAIQVKNIASAQVGHIPKKVAAKLAPLLDQRLVSVEGVMIQGNCVSNCLRSKHSNFISPSGRVGKGHLHPVNVIILYFFLRDPNPFQHTENIRFTKQEAGVRAQIDLGDSRSKRIPISQFAGFRQFCCALLGSRTVICGGAFNTTASRSSPNRSSTRSCPKTAGSTSKSGRSQENVKLLGACRR
jgi:hypothetical protein